MAMTINTNIQSLNAQRNLGASQSSLSTSMQRLSSGLRINSAKDDAAGLAIAERMSAQVRGLNQAQRNANDGVSLAQTAEGALSTIGGNLQRIRELAVQSRNATNSTEDRAALQKEVDQLKSEIDRVATDTSFNGTKLLDGSFTSQAFQVGANQGQRINIDSIQNSQISQLGSWTSADKPASVVSAASMGGTATPGTTGSITFGAPTYTAGELAGAIDGFTLNFGGKELEVKGLDPQASRTAAQVQAAFATNVKTAIDAAGFSGLQVTATATGVTFNNASLNSYTISTTNDAKLPVTNVTVGAGNNYGAIASGALTVNGKNITVDAAYSDADRANQLATAINTEFKDGSVKASIENNRLVLKSDADIVIGGTAANTGTGLTAGTTKVVAGTAQTGFKDISVATAEGADDTILAMDAALKAVNSARADLGAIQNRFESVVSNLSVNSENLSASKSRITDADFAAETANLSRSQILQQAGTAMVAQANQLPQGVLSLLR
ncbi:flagellin [Comamonas thiooxydans]|uniref:flagellin N-terminal helical domain-containing protein n=1 Tax=Comamonas thiooxydans TaxID=363952 RepID=UPI0005F8560A|nr:flagellin [Comamonas thiooxydans]CUB01080.1 Flagellin and related hook-associated protein FlgL [Comamonas thiooxydans]